MTLYGANNEPVRRHGYMGPGANVAPILTGITEVPIDAVHGDRDFKEKVRMKILKYERILTAVRSKNNGMATKGYNPLEVHEAEMKMLKLLDHWRGILRTYGVYE